MLIQDKEKHMLIAVQQPTAILKTSMIYVNESQVKFILDYKCAFLKRT